METVTNGSFLEAPKTKEIQKIVALLKALPDSFSNKVYAVGGCVRDAILGINSADIDIASAIQPQEFLELCQSANLPTYLTGLAHGTITFSIKGITIEHTTFRKDVSTDGRNATVLFADTLEADALRRDFKINALYLNSLGQLFDPTGGYPTLKALKEDKPAFLETVGNAADRFEEDYLRVLRAIRFSKKFGISLSPEIIYELDVKFNYYWIQLEQKVSRERRVEEFRKLISLPPNLKIFEFFLIPQPPKSLQFLYFPALMPAGEESYHNFMSQEHIKTMIKMMELLYLNKRLEFTLALFIGIMAPGNRNIFAGVDNDICNLGYLVSRLLQIFYDLRSEPPKTTVATFWFLKREFFNLIVNKEEYWALWCWITSELGLTLISKDLKKGFAFALAAYYDPELLKGPQINERQREIFCQQMIKT